MKVLKKFVVLTVFLVFCLSLTTFAAETVKLGTYPIPLMVVDKDNGVFVELTKEIAKRANLNIELVVAPPNRTVQGYIDNKLDGFFPALDVLFPPNKKPARTQEIIFVKQDFVFTNKGSKMLATIADLKGKKVGITMGYPYSTDVVSNKSYAIEEGESDEVNTKKLSAGRIDAFVAEEKSGQKAFANSGLADKYQYDAKTPVSKQDVYYGFQNNAKGQQIAAAVSKALADMKKDGTFGKIMSKAN